MMISRFKILIRIEEGREEWVDGDKLFARLIRDYTKAELNGKKPEPYKDKVNNFFKIIDAEWMNALKKAYPNVDVEQELESSKMWLLSNTSQAKSNFKKFINNWMAKAMRAGPTKVSADFKMDSTGNSYIGYCKKCGVSDFYRKEELRSDSHCCNSQILPTKP